MRPKGVEVVEPAPSVSLYRSFVRIAPHAGCSGDPVQFSKADMKIGILFGGHGPHVSVQIARSVVASAMPGQGCSPSLVRRRDDLERADLPG
jgi:hypothetical protein